MPKDKVELLYVNKHIEENDLYYAANFIIRLGDEMAAVAYHSGLCEDDFEAESRVRKFQEQLERTFADESG